MPARRMQRVNEQLRREISEIVRTRLRDPRIVSVVVTSVEAAPDLTFARVFVQLGGSDAERASTLLGLEAATAFTRRLLAEALPLRHTPELRFVEDRTLHRARRIDEILADVEIPDETPEDPTRESEGDAPDPEEEADGSG